MIKNLFYRPIIISNHFQENYLKNLKSKLTHKNLDIFTENNIYDFWDINFEDIFLAYRFHILKNWIYYNEKISSNFLKELHYVIKVLDLNNYLNAYETNYIRHYESINFAQNRNIKKLIVDFSVNKDEEVWFQYSSIMFAQLNTALELITNHPDIYLSNQRIVISTPVEIQSIYWKDVSEFKLVNNRISIYTKYGSFVLISTEILEIYVSVERISKIININI